MILTEKNLKKKFTDTKWKQGLALYKTQSADIAEVNTGYTDGSDEPAYEITAVVTVSARQQYTPTFNIIGGQFCHARCDCSASKHRYYGYWEEDHACAHLAAAGLAFIDYAGKNKVEIITSKVIQSMITDSTNHRITQTIAEHDESKVSLEPKLELSQGQIRVSFRIGAAKKYVIKNLYEFYTSMMSGGMVSYGKDLNLMHHRDVFLEESRGMLDFVVNRIKENLLFSREYFSHYYSDKAMDKRAILLTPHTMDVLFDQLTGKEISFTAEIGTGSSITRVRCLDGNPRLKLWLRRINRNTGKGSRELAGVSIELEEVQYYYGEEHIYIRQGDILYRTDDTYKAEMSRFLQKMASGSQSVIKIGTEVLGSFYRQILDKIRQHLDIIDESNIDLSAYLPPEPEFIFYLDYINRRNIVCKTVIRYGEQEYDPHVQIQGDSNLRDYAKEFEVILRVREYLPHYDEKLGVYHCNQEENRMYLMLEQGIKELSVLGEVNISDAMKRLQLQSSPKVSVGVSIESGLIEMMITGEDLNFDELSSILDSYRLRKRYHRLKNGDFLRLEDDALMTLTELMDGLSLSVKELTKGKLHIPAYRALYLDKVLKEGEGVNYERDQRFRNLIRDFKEVEDSDFVVPTQLNGVLRVYQKHGYRWLRTIEAYQFGGILADDMGLGKTLQVITLLLAAKQEGREETSVIITPASLVYNWQSELSRFAPTLTVTAVTGLAEERRLILESPESWDVLITSYDLLKRDVEHYETKAFGYEIIDEAQYIKNPESQNAKAVKIVKAKVRYALTGTPIENRLSELWSIFDYLMPGFLYRYDRFKKELELPIARENDEVASARLRKLVAPFILRRLKKDVLRDLPDKIEHVTYTMLEGEQRKLYDAYAMKVKKSLMEQSEDEFKQNKIKLLAELTRMRQICCDPSLCYEDYKGQAAKLETCMELIREAMEGGHKILLFSQFTSMLAVIAARLKQEGILYYEITGATAKEKRLQLVDLFNKDNTPIFLISLKAGGTGLNLTGADIVIHYDPWWNVAAQNQATDRAHRIGQQNVVTVFQLIAKDTVEERILKLQEAKKELADQIINGETGHLIKMSKEELLELF